MGDLFTASELNYKSAVGVGENGGENGLASQPLLKRVLE